MKVSLYLENNKQQVHLIPENKFEMNVLDSLQKRQSEIEFHRGTFSECNAGYIRLYNNKCLILEDGNRDDLILVLKDNEQ